MTRSNVIDFADAAERLRARRSADVLKPRQPLTPAGLPTPALWETFEAGIRRWFQFCTNQLREALAIYLKHQTGVDPAFAALAEFVQINRDAEKYQLLIERDAFIVRALSGGEVLASTRIGIPPAADTGGTSA